MIKENSDLKRMARLTRVNLSFKEAFLIGLAGGHVSASKSAKTYNGAGLAGDYKAVSKDLRASVRKSIDSLRWDRNS
ncbi:MAG: hypothetical protein ABF697_08675 [Zymomonas mobilis]|uniref:hypothetical protein n=1 Tax=Zymomonas mobilis TaxID=542 RepID=UPI0039ECA958